MLPKISLITPTKNRVELLLRTIKNVQQQTLQNWEMLVIDDGDGSGREAVQNLNDPRVKAFTNSGSGQVDARNTALQEAQAEVLHLLDDDDRWLDPEHFEQVIAKLGTEPALLHRAGWLVLEQPQNGVWLEQQRLEFSPSTTPLSLRQDNTILTSGVAYRKELHDQLGIFDRDLGNYWDWDWFLRVTMQYPLIQLEPPTVLMSWRGNNTSKDPFDTQKIMFLERLSKKHQLGEIPPKNHFTVIAPSTNIEAI
jgi:glycosyltransferase involved in cell wall biosynthesis